MIILSLFLIRGVWSACTVLPGGPAVNEKKSFRNEASCKHCTMLKNNNNKKH